MTTPPRYATPTAFRRALTDRLRIIASDGRWTLPQLQRQVSYDRLLERLYIANDGWIVKGATALLAREIGTRGTLDIDLYRNLALAAAETELRQGALHDMGDWFRFEIGLARDVAAGTESGRFPVAAYIGATRWAAFHVDLAGNDIQMTGTTDLVPPLVKLAMPDIEQHGYLVYPLVDHLADKVIATFQRYGASQAPSTRYKDLVDLVAISDAAHIDADAQIVALNSEAKRRGVDLPTTYDVPNRALWAPGYAKAAKDARLKNAAQLDDALLLIRAFVDPLLQRTATGRWHPERRVWAK